MSNITGGNLSDCMQPPQEPEQGFILLPKTCQHTSMCKIDGVMLESCIDFFCLHVQWAAMISPLINCLTNNVSWFQFLKSKPMCLSFLLAVGQKWRHLKTSARTFFHHFMTFNRQNEWMIIQENNCEINQLTCRSNTDMLTKQLYYRFTLRTISAHNFYTQVKHKPTHDTYPYTKHIK